MGGSIYTQAVKKTDTKKDAKKDDKKKPVAKKTTGSCPLAKVFGHEKTATKFAKFSGKKFCKGIKNSCCTEKDMEAFNKGTWKKMKASYARSASIRHAINKDMLVMLSKSWTDAKKLGMVRNKKGALTCNTGAKKGDKKKAAKKDDKKK